MISGCRQDLEAPDSESCFPDPAGNGPGSSCFPPAPVLRAPNLRSRPPKRRGDYKASARNVHNYFITAERGKTGVSALLKPPVKWGMVRQQAAGHRSDHVLSCLTPEARF